MRQLPFLIVCLVRLDRSALIVGGGFLGSLLAKLARGKVGGKCRSDRGSAGNAVASAVGSAAGIR